MSIRIIFIVPVVIFLSLVFTDCATNSAVVNPKKIQAIEDMVISYIHQGNLRAALQQSLKAVELDPENPNLHHALAWVYRDLGEYPLSLKHFEKTLVLKPNFPEAQNNLGVLYVRLGDWEQALVYFQMAAGNILYKDQHIAYKNIGSVYFHKGMYQKAIEYYQQALKIYPAYSDAYFNLANAYEATNRWDEAREAYENTIYYNPEYLPAHLNLGKLYLKLRLHTEGAKQLKLAIELDPRGPFAKEARRVLKDHGMEGEL